MKSLSVTGLEIDFTNIDRILTNEVKALKLHLRCLKDDFDDEISILKYLDQPTELKLEHVKEQVNKGINMVSLVAKINDKARGDPDGKIFSSKKLVMKKGGYPSEASLLNGIIFTVMNTDEIYQPKGQCLVVLMPDHPDSDDLVLYLVLERVKTNSKDRPNLAKALDLNKKSDIQVGFTEDEMQARADYSVPK